MSVAYIIVFVYSLKNKLPTLGVKLFKHTHFLLYLQLHLKKGPSHARKLIIGVMSGISVLGLL